MKSIKYYFAFCFCVVSLTVVTGQNLKSGDNSGASIRDELGAAGVSSVRNSYINSGSKYKGVKGSAYLNDEWLDGRLCLARDSVIISKNTVKYKLDLYSNEVWILNGSDSISPASKDLAWLELKDVNGEKLFKKYATNGEARASRFCRVIFEDEVLSLVNDTKKTLRKADFVDKGMYTSGSPYDRFEEKDDYYVGTFSGKLVKTKLASGDILKALGLDKNKALTSRLKKAKLTGKFDEVEVKQFLSVVSDYLKTSHLKN